ncbi:pentatricopeptide repeat-containing protein At3g12770-like [Rhododendron vialii]|uniref:pentatricopeptide repeat-containing protein At3g12770-like n=1 Tax=Rhododendron vialii TaxID=182163 RepID=UPI00265E1D0F|nr:pentatricopeptide repeat-containing protein At3g12770-like [Rhododendron vialii]
MSTHFSTRKTLASCTHFTTRSYTSSSPVLDTSLSLLHLSISRHSLSLTKQSHARLHRLGLDQHPVVATKLISAYSLCQNPVDARLIFDSFRYKNVYIWNTMVNGYAKNYLFDESFDLFSQMCLSEDFSPDGFTLSTLSKACGDIGDLRAGAAIHGKCIRIGFLTDIVVGNSIVYVYCKCGKFIDSRKVFDEMPQRNVSSWNSLIAGLVNSREVNVDSCVWEFVRSMRIDGLEPDAFTVSSLLPLCGGDAERWSYGKELHCYIVKNELNVGLGSDVHLGCCLIDMYSRSNKVNVARRLFDRMESRNVFVWTALINGYVQNGASDEAMVLFREMQVKQGVEPNKVSLVSVLPACSSVAGFTAGKQIHGFTMRKELNFETSLCNALIDMYSKCGSLNLARRVFNDHSFVKDAISWSTMISGYGLHGNGREAICLFEDMLQLGIKPDMITIVGVLSACGRSGLVNEGLTIYNSVVNDYGIKPTLEICACMVNMLGRSGQLKQALEFIKTMPVEPGPSVWGALLSASLLHGNSEMQDLAHNFLIHIEPENPSNFVSISNLYASSQKWDIVAEVRSAMKEKRLRKLPGCSWITLNSKTHSFYVADKAHSCSDMIYEMLEELLLVMKGDFDYPDTEYLT